MCHFIIGEIFISKKINLLIIVSLIFSCVGSQKKRDHNIIPQSKSGIKIYKQHWNLNNETINLFLHIESPLNQFVFTKNRKMEKIGILIATWIPKISYFRFFKNFLPI